ncbi:MAG: hypothetical protein AAF902_23245 [Chloroflexota bacterium]
MDITILLEYGVTWVEFLQSNFPSMRPFMLLLNVLTEPEAGLVLFLSILWGIDRQKGGRYLYLLALIVFTFGMLRHVLQIGPPFWNRPELMLAEISGFAAPNMHAALALAYMLPFKRFIRTDLVIPTFLIVALMAGLSQIYLGLAGPIDVGLGLIVGSMIILLWRGWHKRFGKTFSQRILGQRFWMALLVPGLLTGVHLLLLNFVQQIGYSGFGNIDQELHWRAWQIGYLNLATNVALLAGLGSSLSAESVRIGFRPTGQWGLAILNWLIGFSLLSGASYVCLVLLPINRLLENNLTLGLLSTSLITYLLSFIAVYLIPLVFTVLGTADSIAEHKPVISLNNFSVEQAN